MPKAIEFRSNVLLANGVVPKKERPAEGIRRKARASRGRREAKSTMIEGNSSDLGFGRLVINLEKRKHNHTHARSGQMYIKRKHPR